MDMHGEDGRDTLGRLLQWARLRGQLDLRCRMHDVFALPHAQAADGIALFHAVLEGGCRLGLPDGRWYPLRPGELVVLPRGLAHNLVALQGALPADDSLDDTRRPLQQQGWLPLRSNLPDAACLRDSLDLVCGRFVHEGEVGALLLQALPDVLILGQPQEAEQQPGPPWRGAPIRVVHVPLAWPGEAGGSTLHPVLGLVQLLRQEAAAEQPGARDMAELLTQALLLHVLRAYAQSEAVRQLPGVLNLLAEPRLQGVVQAMWQQPGGDWSLDSLAERAAMSRATFTRQFAQHAGMSPWAFLTQLRMLHGMELLRDPRHSLAQIAGLTGYQSESAFNVAFRKYSGQTPARYRREHG